MLDEVQSAIINDFLYSNEVCYQAFLGSGEYNSPKLQTFVDKVFNIDRKTLSENYVSLNYGGKYFSNDNAKMIGFIREKIQSDYEAKKLNMCKYSRTLRCLHKEGLPIAFCI